MKSNGKTWQQTTGLGDEAELAVALALVRSGKKLLRPLSSASRYDLLIDNEDGTFVRVQCKAGRLRNGRIEFRLYSMSGHRGTTGMPYLGQVDAFGVYCRQTLRVYLVPMSELSGRRGAACLRVAPTRNGQRRRIRSAAAYLIPEAAANAII